MANWGITQTLKRMEPKWEGIFKGIWGNNPIKWPILQSQPFQKEGANQKKVGSPSYKSPGLGEVNGPPKPWEGKNALQNPFLVKIP